MSCPVYISCIHIVRRLLIFKVLLVFADSAKAIVCATFSCISGSQRLFLHLQASSTHSTSCCLSSTYLRWKNKLFVIMTVRAPTFFLCTALCLLSMGGLSRGKRERERLGKVCRLSFYFCEACAFCDCVFSVAIILQSNLSSPPSLSLSPSPSL